MGFGRLRGLRVEDTVPEVRLNPEPSSRKRTAAVPLDSVIRLMKLHEAAGYRSREVYPESKGSTYQNGVSQSRHAGGAWAPKSIQHMYLDPEGK